MLRLLVASLLAALPAAPVSRLSGDELELLRSSLRPAGLSELESHAAPLGQLPLSEVEASLEPETGKLDGHLRLIFTNREAAPIETLLLRLAPNAGAPKGQTPLRADQLSVDGLAVHSRTRGTLLEIDLPGPLAPGSALVLALTFHGKLARMRSTDDATSGPAEMLAQLAPGLAGTKASARKGDAPAVHGTFAAGSVGAVLFDWYPLLASRSGGAWDESEPGAGPGAARLQADVGSAIVSLSVPRGTKVFGAGVALGQHGSGKGEVAAFALAGLRGALGLVALEPTTAVAQLSDPIRVEPDPKSATIRLHVASLHGPQGARALLSCARAALTDLSARWGPYPWADLSLVEMPLPKAQSGAHETGLSLLARGLGGGVVNPLLDQGAADALPEAPGLFTFNCHREVARQWFRAVVGSDPRAVPWLDEALTLDGAVRVAASQAGGGDPGKIAADTAERRFIALNFQGMRAMGLPDLRADLPASAFNTLPAYSGVLGGKAPIFLARVRQLLGDAKVDAAIRSLRNQRAFREARDVDLLAALDKTDASRAPQLDALADRWLRELHGDEDIAPLDASDLLDGMGGGNAGAAQLAQLMRLFAPGVMGGGPGQLDPQNLADQERQLRKAMKDLERQLPELKRLMDQAMRGQTAGP
jgi:hypothetical protein